MSNWTVIDHLTNYLMKKRLGDPSAPSLWPSEASAIVTNKHGESEVVGKCRRATFFRYLTSNYEYWVQDSRTIDWTSQQAEQAKEIVQEAKSVYIPPSKYQNWIFKQGDLYEDYIINMAKDSGIYIADQVRVYIPKWNISGKIDLVVVNPETGKYRKTEVKSVYGFNGNYVLGTPGGRKSGQSGQPRDSNLIQIAIYDAKGKTDEYEDSSLVYGSRDTGRYAEYRIRTDKDENGIINIFYMPISPNRGPEVKSPITLNSVLDDGYVYVSRHVNEVAIPPRDYSLEYSEEDILKKYARKELSKTNAEQIEKIIERKQENATRIAEGKKPKQDLKPPEMGDWQCDFCAYKDMCYKENKSSREL